MNRSAPHPNPLPPGEGEDSAEVLILGTGVAGCAAALAAARGGAQVTIVTRASHAEASNTLWAQGGIVGRPPGDAPEALAADIQKAGDGICSPEAVALLATEGPDLVQKLLVDELQVPFDRHGSGFDWTREGGHAIPRILHVKDETGAPIERALLEACHREPGIRWQLQTTAVDLLTLSHDSTEPYDRYRPPTVVGAYLLERRTGEVPPSRVRGISSRPAARRVYLSTNPDGARGDGSRWRAVPERGS
jgi:L-aspartate oxidase